MRFMSVFSAYVMTAGVAIAETSIPLTIGQLLSDGWEVTGLHDGPRGQADLTHPL